MTTSSQLYYKISKSSQHETKWILQRNVGQVGNLQADCQSALASDKSSGCGYAAQWGSQSWLRRTLPGTALDTNLAEA
jgi:hypothetical protein